MNDEKEQLVSESIPFCSPLASVIRAGEVAPIGQLQFEDTLMDVEGQEKKKVFDEEVNDKEKIDAKETDFQDSRGSLETEEQCSFETLSESFEELDISVLEHFVGIPDFNLPIDSKYPLVVHTPCGYHCTDGWELVEAAIAAGRNSITCHVKYLKDHSEDELSLRKAAGRVKPEAGIASYSETVRNVKYLERRLLANSNLKVFCHGGARRGDVFANNTEDNLRKVLSIRLGRSVTTINLFLNHGAFLSDETLNFLASENTVKEFFEKVQTAKRTQITAMKSSRASDEDISAEISKMMIDWHAEYEETGKITPVWIQSETDTETGSRKRSTSTGASRNHQSPKFEEPQDSDGADDAPDDDIESLQEPTEAETTEEVLSNPKELDTQEQQEDSTPEEQEESDSFEKVKGDVEESAKRLLATVAVDDPNLFYKQIVEEVAYLHHISLRARVFGKEATL